MASGDNMYVYDDNVFMLYDSVSIISDYETKLKILYHAEHACVEVVCFITGIFNDTLTLYLDYDQLTSTISTNAIGGDDKLRAQRRLEALVEYLLTHLAIVLDSHQAMKCRLILQNKRRKDRSSSIFSGSFNALAFEHDYLSSKNMNQTHHEEDQSIADHIIMEIPDGMKGYLELEKIK